MNSSRGKPGRLLLSVIVACLVYIGIEGLCYLGLRALHAKGVDYEPLPSVLSQDQKNSLIARLKDDPPLRGHHPALGWLRSRSTQDVTINSQGIRSVQEHSTDVDPKRIRVSAFGDSFTFGDEVADVDTWEYQLAELDARFEVLNFGMGAYGLDQAYLRYLQEGVRFHADIVIIGFMSENIYRNLTVFRPFYSGMYKESVYTKPRFSVGDGRLVLWANPLATADDYARFVNDDEAVLREIGRHDYFYQTGYLAGPLDPLPSVRLSKITMRTVRERLNPVVTSEGSYAASSEALNLTEKILEEFHCSALQQGSLPVIVIYPDLGDFERHRAGRPERYEPLMRHLKTKGFRYVDVLDAIVLDDPEVRVDRLTVGQWGHYSRLGNRIVARHLHRYLTEQRLVSREAIKALARTVQEQQGCRPKVTFEPYARPGVP